MREARYLQFGGLIRTAEQYYFMYDWMIENWVVLTIDH